MPRLSFCRTGGLMVGRQTEGESERSLLEPPVGRRRGLRPRSGELDGEAVRDVFRDVVRSMPMLLRAALAKVSAMLSCGSAGRDEFACHWGLLCLVVVTAALLESDESVEVDELDVWRDGRLGRELSLVEVEVEFEVEEDDAEPDRKRSDLAGVDSLAAAAAASAALAFSRIESSSRLLPSPGGVIRSSPSMRIWGGDRLSSRLDGGVSVMGCGIGRGLGSLSSCGGGM